MQCMFGGRVSKKGLEAVEDEILSVGIIHVISKALLLLLLLLSSSLR